MADSQYNFKYMPDTKDVDQQTEEALRTSISSGSLQSKEEQKAAQAALKVFTDQRNTVDFTVKDAATFVAEMTPIIGDAIAAKDVYEELQKDEPNYYLAGALGGAAIIGLIPGVGDIAAKAIKKGAREVFDVAKRVKVDPNAMGSGLGNVRLKPKVSALKENPKAEADTFPPAENAARTQIAGTLPTYKKADTLLTELSGEGKTLDFGAGLGLSKKELGFDTYEPFPKGDFTPDFNNPTDIPSNSYKKVTNLNVLNVVPRDVRDTIVKDIGRVLEPNGRAVITTRGRDVMDAKGTVGPEPMSIITTRDTYQKGFTQPELSSYITETLGEGFAVTNNKLGAAGVTVHKLPTANFNEGGLAMNNESQMAELFEEGGIADDGMRVDPVSGNEIPPGSMASEVRDDVPAQLSEGEYVVPADVLRFYGVKFFEDLRSEAKQGMMKMEVDGRIGGEPVAAEGQQDMDALTPEEMAVLQEMGMAEGGMVPQQRVGYNEAGLEDGRNANTMAANVSTQYGRGSGIDRARGVAPATTAAVRMVMLYSPDGLTSQAFTLPAQQVEHDARIAEGWSATQVGVTTQTSVGQDNENDSNEPPSTEDYYSTQTTDALQGQLESLESGKGLNSFLNNFLDKGLSGKIIKGVTGKTVMERSINSLKDELKKRKDIENGGGSSNSSTDANATTSGNSFSEFLANIVTPFDGAKYVNGQLVDDAGNSIKPGTEINGKIITGSANNPNNDSTPSNSNDDGPSLASRMQDRAAEKTAEKAATTAAQGAVDAGYGTAQGGEFEGFEDEELEETGGGDRGMSKGGFISKRSKKKNK